MASESGTFRHVAEVHKWSEEQTAEAARRHGVEPDDLTHEHFTSLGMEPDEHVQVDHTEGRVIHTQRGKGENAVTGRTVYTIEEWNRRHTEEAGD